MAGHEDEWLTPAEVAARHKVARVTVYRALKAGQLHAHKVSPNTRTGRWRVRPAAADAWQMGLNGRTACGCLHLARAS